MEGTVTPGIRCPADILYTLNRKKSINFTSKSRFESPFDEIILFTGKLTIKSPKLVLNFGSVPLLMRFLEESVLNILLEYVIGISRFHNLSLHLLFQ